MGATEDGNRVLLIEDDARLRSVLARTLRRHGLQVIEADSASAARAIFESDELRAAVIDVNLPDGTGWDIVRWVRSRGEPAPKLIVISAADFPVSHIRELRPDASLNKPFPIDALIQHLNPPVIDETGEPR